MAGERAVNLHFAVAFSPATFRFDGNEALTYGLMGNHGHFLARIWFAQFEDVG